MADVEKIKIIKKELSDNDLLVKYIETVTHSGLPTLDKELMVKIKDICRKSSSNVENAYSTLVKQLKKNHAQMRLSAFQVIVELFKKAHIFRELVVKNLEEILQLTAEIKPEKPLPPPKDVAKALKELALLTVEKWKTEYGSSYKQFLVCYNYLKRLKKIDFEAMVREAAAAEAAQWERDREVQRAKNLIINAFSAEFDVSAPEIENSIRIIYNCISLLLPPLEDFFLSENTEEDLNFTSNSNLENEDNFNMRLFGLSSSYNLVINLDYNKKIRIHKNNENTTIIDNLKENLRLVKKKFNRILRKREEILKISLDVTSDHEESLVTLKNKVEYCFKKIKELDIEGLDDDDSDDDEDMEEVVKEGYEPAVLPILQDPGPSTSRDIQNKLRKENENLHKKPTEEVVTNFFRSCDNHGSKKRKNDNPDEDKHADRKKRLLTIAPKLPYDIDLYHWEDQNLTAPTLVSMKMGAPKFWGSGDAGEVDEIPAPDGVAALRTRVIEFTGKFEPVERACRVLLPSGKLCPRQDRIKCPFHGTIVPRDDNGKCVRPEDEPSSSAVTLDSQEVRDEENETVPDWQDPVLLAQLKAATGIDLKMPDKKKKKKEKVMGKRKRVKRKRGDPSMQVLEDIKKRKFPGLVDLERRKNEARARLKKKIFSRRALKRVAETVDKIERRKHKDKFGDQFNYYITQ